jgi:hypothetical protein
MKKVKTILIAVVVGLIYSCSKSDLIEPIALQDSPHKKDTTVNNYIPHIVALNK